MYYRGFLGSLTAMALRLWSIVDVSLAILAVMKFRYLKSYITEIFHESIHWYPRCFMCDLVFMIVTRLTLRYLFMHVWHDYSGDLCRLAVYTCVQMRLVLACFHRLLAWSAYVVVLSALWHKNQNLSMWVIEWKSIWEESRWSTNTLTYLCVILGL